jgi:dihydroflavonol-4-reductase
VILVTGATGHIGNVLVRLLLESGQRVRALVLPGEDCKPLQNLPVKLIEGDVLDYRSILKAMQGVEIVYHLAGMISIMPGDDHLLRLVNIVGTRNVLYACRNTHVKRLIYTSSIHALSRIPQGMVIDENVPFDTQNAISDYDHSKAQASLEVKTAVGEGLDAVLACPTGVIGPYDFRCSEIGQLILDCLRRKPQFYFDGAYDFVDVRDVAQGLIQSEKFGKTGETYILSGEKITVQSLLDQVREISGFNFLKFKVPLKAVKWLARHAPQYYRLFKQKPRLTPYAIATLLSNSVISHAKAAAELGYQPRPLLNSLQDTIHWLRENFLLSGFPT